MHSRISATGFSSPMVTRSPSPPAKVVMRSARRSFCSNMRRRSRVVARSQNSGWSSMLMAPLT